MNTFSVETIKRRQFRNGKIWYLLKWENYPKPSWEPEENLIECEDLINDFDDKRAVEFLGARFVNGRSEFLLRYGDNWPNRIVPLVEAIEKWPSLILRFLEQHIKLISPGKSVTFTTIEESLTIGDPIECKYVSKALGDFNYWFDWPQQTGRYLHADEIQWDHLKIRYLHSRLNSMDATGSDSSSVFIGRQMITRRMAATLKENRFESVEVRIIRSTPYDRCLLMKERQNIKRRQTLNVASNQTKSILKKRHNSMGALGSATDRYDDDDGNNIQLIDSATNIPNAELVGENINAEATSMNASALNSASDLADCRNDDIDSAINIPNSELVGENINAEATSMNTSALNKAPDSQNSSDTILKRRSYIDEANQAPIQSSSKTFISKMLIQNK